MSRLSGAVTRRSGTAGTKPPPPPQSAPPPLGGSCRMRPVKGFQSLTAPCVTRPFLPAALAAGGGMLHTPTGHQSGACCGIVCVLMHWDSEQFFRALTRTQVHTPLLTASVLQVSVQAFNFSVFDPSLPAASKRFFLYRQVLETCRKRCAYLRTCVLLHACLSGWVFMNRPLSAL